MTEKPLDEWAASKRDQGSAMGLDNGTFFKCCAYCGGLKPCEGAWAAGLGPVGHLDWCPNTPEISSTNARIDLKAILIELVEAVGDNAEMLLLRHEPDAGHLRRQVHKQAYTKPIRDLLNKRYGKS